MAFVVVVALLVQTRPLFAAGAPYRHDHLFLKMGALLGPAFHNYDADLYTGVRHRGHATSVNAGLELMLGGSLRPGLALGGGLMVFAQPSPRYDNAAVTKGWDKVSGGTGSLGVFAQFYPRPASGLHLIAFAGLALEMVRFEQRDPANPYECPAIAPDCIARNLRTIQEERRFTGGAFMLAGGYDFWIAKQWSLGVTGRVAYVTTGASSSQFGSGMSYSLIVPLVGFSGTFN